ncbi:uncharacterized protein LOC121971823 [Zingiber officinale]|uniref:DUF4378 domain-containing protein n=1 Tax=Zingiber officinale TaxID=94328 RepID=A0A8J5H5G0_ZINOF|nr:uncharacterized protein LOC121971823 [Zingiber officinale]KAG6516419.1 hypothetical protein ZIOFF_026884 [Zingiber officinale]
MENLLQHQNSTAVFQRHYRSCVWDWPLRIFDLHHRIGVRKLLDDGNHRSGSRPSGRDKNKRFYLPLRVNEHDNVDDEARVPILNKANQPKRSSGKALVKSLIVKKLFRKHLQKQKSVTLRLTRTNSIHRSDYNNYVPPAESTESSKRKETRRNGTIKGVSFASQAEIKGLDAQNEEVVEESVDRLGREANNIQSHDFARTMELFSVQNESFSEMIDDPDTLKNVMKDFRRSSSQEYVAMASPNLLQKSFKHRIAELDEHTAHNSSDFLSRSSLESPRQVYHVTGSSHSNNANRHVRDAIVRKKENRHVSMDGLLHKIPYGQTLPVTGDGMKEMLLRSASARSYREGKSDSPVAPSEVHSQRFRRSHSLSEPSDLYQHTFKPSSTGESKRLSQSLMPIEEDHGTMLLKQSTPSDPSGMDEAVDLGNELLNIKSSFELDTTLAQTSVESADATIVGGQLPSISNELIDDEMSSVSGTSETSIGCITLRKHGSNIELQKCDVDEVSDSPQMQDSSVAIEVDSIDESITPSSTSVIDLDPKVDLLRPTNLELPRDPETDTGSLHVDGHDFLGITDNEFSFNIIHAMSDGSQSYDERKPKSFVVDDKSQTHLDREADADFDYVRNALTKSGIIGIEYAGAQLVGPLLSQESCEPSDYLEFASYESSDVSPHHQLLSDMINEILLELYERFSFQSWFSHFDSQLRTLPMESNVLGEVWKKITIHLNSQSQPNLMCQDSVAQDYVKDDGWLNFRPDAVSLGVEIESFVWDELLEELSFEYLEDI